MKIMKMVLILTVIIMTGFLTTSCGTIGNLLIGSRDVDLKLYEGIILDNFEMMNEALEDGANINKITGRLPSDSIPVWVAVKHATSHRVLEYLINKGADVNIPKEDGLSLLEYYANNTDVYFCDLLLQHGAKVDYEYDGYTALEYVLDFNNRATGIEKNVDKILTMLLDNGAKIRPESLVASLKGVRGRSSKTMYLVKKRILEGLINEGYKSGLDPVLEASLLGDSNRVNELINAGKMKEEDEVLISNYTEAPSKIPKSITNETTYKEHILYSTSAFGSVETMKLFKEKGFDLKYKDGKNFTLLMAAANYGNLEMVKYLVNEGLSIDGRSGDKSALYFAVENDHYDVVGYLVKMGADIKPYKNGTEITDVFTPAWNNGNEKMMNLLIDNGYKLKKSVNDCLFINALNSNNPEELKKYTGYNYHGFDYTAALGSYGEKLETIKFLVENGADIKGTNESNILMILASSAGETDILDYLISKGASVNAVTIASKDSENAGKNVDSALYKAIVNGNFETVKLLVDNGADLDLILTFTDGTETPVMTAAGCGSKHILEYIINKGANLNFQNSNGETALMHAAANGRIDNVKLLVGNNADKSLMNKDGLTALDLAKEKKYKDIVKFLEK